jgi:hypothetical protein
MQYAEELVWQVISTSYYHQSMHAEKDVEQKDTHCFGKETYFSEKRVSFGGKTFSYSK